MSRWCFMEFDEVSFNDIIEVFDDVDIVEVDLPDVSSSEILVYFDTVSGNDVSDNDNPLMLSDLSENSGDYSAYLAEISTGIGEINTNLNLILGVGLLCLAIYFSKRLINMFKE